MSKKDDHGNGERESQTGGVSQSILSHETARREGWISKTGRPAVAVEETTSRARSRGERESRVGVVPPTAMTVGQTTSGVLPQAHADDEFEETEE